MQGSHCSQHVWQLSLWATILHRNRHNCTDNAVRACLARVGSGQSLIVAVAISMCGFYMSCTFTDNKLQLHMLTMLMLLTLKAVSSSRSPSFWI